MSQAKGTRCFCFQWCYQTKILKFYISWVGVILKINLIFSVIYILVIISIFLSITVFLDECLHYWELIFMGRSSYCCPCWILPTFCVIVIPSISAIFAALLSRAKWFMFIPVFMSALVFSLFLLDGLIYNMRHNIMKTLDIRYVFPYLMCSFPTFIGSILGIVIGNLIYAIYCKFKEYHR